MEDWQREADAKRNEERKKLLAISEEDALKLPTPDRYQRIRYLREIEATTYLAEIRRNLPVSNEKQAKRPRYTGIKHYWEN
jgi:hypothetical protein